jgi:hypothetical protein
MREVCAVLEEIKAAVEAGVSMGSFAKRLLPKPETSARLRIFTVLGLFVVAFSVSAFYYFRPDSSPINFANMTLRKLSQTNNVRFAHVTPDGKSIVYQTADENDRRALWIRRVEEKNRAATRCAAAGSVLGRLRRFVRRRANFLHRRRTGRPARRSLPHFIARRRAAQNQ